MSFAIIRKFYSLGRQKPGSGQWMVNKIQENVPLNHLALNVVRWKITF